jgi:hypothetical protein
MKISNFIAQGHGGTEGYEILVSLSYHSCLLLSLLKLKIMMVARSLIVACIPCVSVPL